MTVYYMPSITPTGYDEIKTICGDRMPMTFGEWRNTQENERRAHLYDGDIVLPVAISVSDFREYCKTTKYRPEPALLANLSLSLATQRKIEYPHTPTGSVPQL
jgi:hypothetical protein